MIDKGVLREQLRRKYGNSPPWLGRWRTNTEVVTEDSTIRCRLFGHKYVVRQLETPKDAPLTTINRCMRRGCEQAKTTEYVPHGDH